MLYTSTTINQLEKSTNILINNPSALFTFITQGLLPHPVSNCFQDYNHSQTLLNRSKIITGQTSFNFDHSTKIHSFDHIHNPPSFTWSLYPLNQNKTDFAYDRPFNYCCNFEVNSLIEIGNSEPIPGLYRYIFDLVHQTQFQTRGGDLYRNLASVLLTLDILLGTQNHIIRILLGILFEPYRTFPVWQSHNEFRFADDVRVSTYFPLLIYMFTSLGIDIIAGVFTPIEALVAANNYLFYCEKSIFDTYLQHKSKLNSWHNTAIVQLGKVKTPVFSISGELIGKTVVDCSRDKAFSHLSVNNLADYPYKPTLLYLNQILRHIQTPENFIRAQTICRTITNTRLYLATTLELGKEAGSGARVEGNFVTAPTPLETLNNGDILSLASLGDTNQYKPMLAYLENYRTAIISDLQKLDPNQKFIESLTTRSSGHKISGSSSSNIVQKASNIRIVNAALSGDEYNSELSMLGKNSEPTRVGVRYQIARRARQIFVVSNWRFFQNVPIYLTLLAFTSLSKFAHFGKQFGGVTDFAEPLATTSMGILHSSSDVSGMDASYQRTLQMVLLSFVLNVVKHVPHSHFGPYFTKLMEVFDHKTGKISNQSISALHQCVANAIGFRINPISFVSPLFGTMVMENQPFGSGLLSTSVNHTVTIIAIQKGADYKNQSTARSTLHSLGDDQTTTAVLPERKIKEFLDRDENEMKKHGFKLETSASYFLTEFLQQCVFCARAAPYYDRISIPCAERANFKSSPKERCDEDHQLLSDLANRGYNIEGLSFLMFIKSVITNRRVSLVAKPYQLEKLQKLKEGVHVGGDCFIKTLEPMASKSPTSKRSTNQDKIVQITFPIAWLMIHNGGEVTLPRLERSDGTFTPTRSIFAPRGEYSNRIIYELSQDVQTLNHELLRKYKLDSGYMLSKINMQSFRQSVRSAKLDRDEIRILADKLNTNVNARLLAKSDEGYRELQEHNVKIPQNLVYSFQSEEKIYSALLSPEIDKFEILPITDVFIDVLTATIQPIQETKPMRAHRYSITNSESGILVPLKYPFLSDCSVQPNAYPFSPVFLLYQTLGFMRDIDVRRLSTLSAITGKYGVFKIGDTVFDWAMKIAKSYPLLLDAFFDAINASPNVRHVYRNALRYLISPKETPYPHVLTNRQLMIINPDFNAANNLLEDNDGKLAVVTKHGQRFPRIVSYAYVLSSCEQWLGQQLSISLWPEEARNNNRKRKESNQEEVETF